MEQYSVDIIPHKDPFLFVDQIEEINILEKTILCSRIFSEDEPFFEGHFPEYKILPGVFLIETMAQTVAVLFLHGKYFDSNIEVLPLLTKVKNAKFINKVLPNEKLFIKGQVKEMNQSFLSVSAYAEVYNESGKKVCKAELDFVIKELSTIY